MNGELVNQEKRSERLTGVMTEQETWCGLCRQDRSAGGREGGRELRGPPAQTRTGDPCLVPTVPGARGRVRKAPPPCQPRGRAVCPADVAFPVAGTHRVLVGRGLSRVRVLSSGLQGLGRSGDCVTVKAHVA